MPATYAHPSPALYRRSQHLTAGIMLLILLAAPLQVLLGVLIQGALLFYLTAVLTLLLLLPLLMQTTATPPVTISQAGITIQPALWRERMIPWDAVQAVKPYPLLPPSDTEVVRKAMVGRKTYRPAEGMMLVIPSLPWVYRATGFFAGEGWISVIALTSRTHTNYDDLIKQVVAHSRTP